MPFKTILASLTGFGSDRAVLDAAVAMARPEASHIQCLHTRIDVSQTADFIGASAHKSDVLYDLTQKMVQEQRARSQHAKEVFHDACKRHALPSIDRPEQNAGISVSWNEAVTIEDETLEQSRYHDLTVMGRDRELSKEALLAVLMRSGRPLLLAPPRPVETLGHNVVIGWKNTPEAARSLTAAMPLLPRARKVVIASISSNKAENDTDRLSAERLSRQLAWHGIKAEVHVEYPDSLSEGEALSSFCYANGADLLVMGAYGHSRMREAILGGVTKAILADCSIPVFLFR